MQIAENENLVMFSITDHDSFEGTEIAEELSDHFSFQYLTGIELSARYEGKKIEILGYNFDTKNEKLKTKLKDLQKAREERIKKILTKLNDLNLHITLDEILTQIGTAKSPGRPHFARTLLSKNYVKSVHEAFDKYLNEGKPAYVPRKTIKSEEAIKLIHKARGTAILPHPLYIEAIDLTKLEEILDLILTWDIDGIEVYYNYYHSDFNLPEKKIKDAISFLERYCKRNDLLITGGTDFHGDTGKLGEIPIPSENINQLFDFFSSL
ncbi:MAG: PHP domain-containing protein [Candidatus Heimdallarchaeota archaeon]|nr:PHP domain-containing protein [Candidatus Heimdallarchaeota archaeon]MCK4954513.1 PHP domain-containing protein [Candidatus Heimdallarchaeota archaeon]